MLIKRSLISFHACAFGSVFEALWVWEVAGWGVKVFMKNKLLDVALPLCESEKGLGCGGSWVWVLIVYIWKSRFDVGI